MNVLYCLECRNAIMAAALLLSTLLTGCANPGRRESGGRPPGVVVIYQSRGEIVGLSALKGGAGDQVLVWEDLPLSRPPTVRLLSLDVSSGKTKVLHEGVLDPSQMFGHEVALSNDGSRIAANGSDDGADHPKHGMYVSDDFRTWALVTPLDNRVRILPRWSPDATALAFLSMEPEHYPHLIPMEAVVVSVPRPARPGKETILTPEGGRSIDVAWAADGQCLYQAVSRPDRSGFYLETLDWPSLERRTVMTGGPLGLLSVAGETGDVVWMEEEGNPGTTSANQAGQGRVLRRLSPDGKPERTPVRPDRAPFLAVVSPDGRSVAVVPKLDTRDLHPWGKGLVIYSVRDGAPRAYSEFRDTEVISVAWVLGGRGLAIAERGKRVWLVWTEAGL